MTEVSKILLEMYKDIKKILDKHEITFYIQYGTAIGALRHNGLIPWDDDIDILVWEKDMEEINEVLSRSWIRASIIIISRPLTRTPTSYGRAIISSSRSRTRMPRS